MNYFEIVKNKKEEFVVFLRAKNGDLLFKTEGFADKATAKKLATKIRDLKPETEIRDLTVAPKPEKATAKPSAKKAAPAKKPAVKSKTQELLDN